LPKSVGDPSVLGMILASNVEQVAGSKPSEQAARPRPREPFLIRGFGEIGFLKLTASDSFNAIFDKDWTWIPGGGVDAIWPSGVFGSAEVEWFQMTGERAFVLGDQVFPLGIEDKITAIPISMTFGYKFGRSRVARPYAGGGFGVFLFKEEADFAENGDDVSEQFASFHVTGGVDLYRTHRVSTAVEARYNWVRNAIGKGGVSAEFDEQDLGGFTIKVKVLFR
jgi:opacity protein-like surface antigen